MAHDVPLGCAPDEYDDLISGTCSHLPNRIRSYLMAAFNYGLKADNDPMNTSVGITFGLEVNPVSAIPKQSSAEKVGDTWLTLEELRFVMEQFARPPTLGR
jgi:hypothetical protein